MRAICQGGGTKVSSAVEGLKLLAAGQAVNYEGASGPCDLTDIGDITTAKFRFEQVRAGKPALLSIS